jgi:outer membrane protein OmpA-like peptidoglycan-associated protein
VENDVTHLGLDLVVSVPWKFAPYLLGGWHYVKFDNNDPNWGNNTFHGWEFGGGLKWFVAPRIALRFEARDVMFDFENPPGEAPDGQTHNWFISAGIEVAIDGATAVADEDLDGVADPEDSCPGTLFGAVVDAKGCALDEDSDGVPDGLDVCPGTQARAVVDQHGCPRDADRDGVPDGADECPDTPAGYPVDAKGCPRDSDGDGVLDGADKCPGTPTGATIDVNGCPRDTDRDGVPDGIDMCADTPLGARVGPTGCPSDADGDGVPDGADKCPGTPVNVRVDKDGCPIEVSEKEVELLDTGKITVRNIRFETNKANLMLGSHAVLDEIGAILVQWPDLRIEIGGHADARGTDEYNRTLSQKRAQSVLDYLVAKFPQVPAGQYVAKGYGESQPVATNETAEGMALNRRVEFKVLNPEVMRKEIERRRTLEKQD